jgi:hypothetical protein
VDPARVATLIGRKFTSPWSPSTGLRPSYATSSSDEYRPDTLDGFIAGTGLTLDDPASP